MPNNSEVSDAEEAAVGRLLAAYARTLRDDLAAASAGERCFVLITAPQGRPGRTQLVTNLCDDHLRLLLEGSLAADGQRHDRSRLLRGRAMNPRAYADRTHVPVDRSKAEIERMLRTAGASSIATLVEDERAAQAFKMRGVNYRFIVPFAEPRLARREQLTRQRWRALVLTVKAKLEAARSGITSIEVEMLPYAVLPGGKTVSDEALPALERAYASGRDVPLLPGV